MPTENIPLADRIDDQPACVLRYCSSIRTLCCCQRATSAEKGGETALHWAAANGHLDVAKCLIGIRARLTDGDEKRAQPLYSAAAQRHHTVVGYFAELRADLAGTDVAASTQATHWTNLY